MRTGAMGKQFPAVVVIAALFKLGSAVSAMSGPALAFDDAADLPVFVGHAENKTVRAGDAVVLACQVKHLANYKVAWVRVDTQTILTIHHHIITRNQRVSLSHHDKEIWRLHVDNVEENDRGWYMCQINTDPMRSQKVFLEVVVPPTIVDSGSPSDIVVRENSPVTLECEATGFPRPELRWRRADGSKIRYKGGTGIYYCIASNGVPPTKSKSIDLKVQFAPMIWVQNQQEMSALGQNITLHCNAEAFPTAIHFWTFENGSAIAGGPGSKYRIREQSDQLSTQMMLDIVGVDKEDFGTYFCVAKNSLGQQDGKTKLSERYVASTLQPTYNDDRRDEDDRDVIEVVSTQPAFHAINYDPYVPDRKSKERDKERRREDSQRRNAPSTSVDPYYASDSATAVASALTLTLTFCFLASWLSRK